MFNTKTLKNSKNGFTLIELIIVILVISIFGALTADILANAVNIYSSALNRQKFISEARYSFFKIKREASWQKSPASFSGGNNKKLNILSVDGKSINYEIKNNNKIIHTNSQVTASSDELLTDKIDYNNSMIYYIGHQGTEVNVVSQLEDVKSLMLDFRFNSGNETIRLTGHALPYNLHIGRAMSYHE